MNFFTGLPLSRHQALVRLYRKDILETFHLSYPIVIAQIGIILLGLTDTLMVSPLGASALAASGIANSIFFLFSVIGLGMMSVVSPLVAAEKSRSNAVACNLLLANTLRIAFLAGVLIAIILGLLSYYFEMFDQPTEVTTQAKSYLIIIAVSTIPMLIFVGTKTFLEGLSMTKPAMYATYIGVVLNIILNWIFIYGKFGFPAWGLDGAGFATLISRIMMAAILLYFLMKSKKVHALISKINLFKFDNRLTLTLLKLGIPSGLQIFFEVGAFSGAAIMIGWLGTNALAAHQIAISLASTTYLIALGVSVAGSIRVADAYGIHHQARIFRAGNTAFFIVVVFMSICCIIFIAFNDFLVHLYISDPEVVEIATALMVVAAFFQLSDGVQVTGLGLLRGITDVNIPTLITLFAYWVVGLPLAYWLAFSYDMGVVGIWIGLAVGLTISAFFVTFRFYHLLNRRMDVAKQDKVVNQWVNQVST